MVKVLITGAAGFLGRHVVREFERHGAIVVPFDNFDARCGSVRGCCDVPRDVTDFKQLETLVRHFGIDTIIHLAAYGRNLTCQDFAQRAFEVNVDGTHNVLEIARLYPGIVRRVVVCSSNIVLSDVPTIYKMTKALDEQLVASYARLGVSCMALRPSNICGTGQSRTEYQTCSFAGLDLGFERDGYFSVTGDGSQSRDFTNARDVARAFWLAANSEISGTTIDVCTGHLVSLNEIAAILKVPIHYVAVRPGDAKTLISDPEPAKRLLGFEAEVGIEESLRDSFPAVMASKNGAASDTHGDA